MYFNNSLRLSMFILTLCMKNLDIKVKWGFDSVQENSDNLHINSSYESKYHTI